MQTHLPLYQKMGEAVSRCGGVKLRQHICLSFNISYGNDNQSPYTEPRYLLSVSAYSVHLKNQYRKGQLFFNRTLAILFYLRTLYQWFLKLKHTVFDN